MTQRTNSGTSNRGDTAPQQPSLALRQLERIQERLDSNLRRAVLGACRGQLIKASGCRHTYDEFTDNHSDVDYRMDTSLPFLYKVLC